MHLKTRQLSRTHHAKLAVTGLGSLAVVCALVFTTVPTLRAKLETARNQALSVFKLDRVEWRVTGSSNLAYKIHAEELLRVSGLKKGDPLFAVPQEELRTRLHSIPWIKDVSVRAALSGVLTIEILPYKAKAIGLRAHRPWVVSEEGIWVAPLDQADWKTADYPVISGFAEISEALDWIDAFDREFSGKLLQVHEITMKNVDTHDTVVIAELVYKDQSVKLSIHVDDEVLAQQHRVLIRLKRVVQYLIKNNILASAIDLRAGQKAVVRVGKPL